jgi:hypothetical protein
MSGACLSCVVLLCCYSWAAVPVLLFVDYCCSLLNVYLEDPD